MISQEDGYRRGELLLEALNMVEGYQNALKAHLAEEAVGLDSASESPLHSGIPDALEKYRNLFWTTQVSARELKRELMATVKKFGIRPGSGEAAGYIPEKEVALGELLCPKCGKTIPQDAISSCPSCGWAWLH